MARTPVNQVQNNSNGATGKEASGTNTETVLKSLESHRREFTTNGIGQAEITGVTHIISLPGCAISFHIQHSPERLLQVLDFQLAPLLDSGTIGTVLNLTILSLELTEHEIHLRNARKVILFLFLGRNRTARSLKECAFSEDVVDAVTSNVIQVKLAVELVVFLRFKRREIENESFRHMLFPFFSSASRNRPTFFRLKPPYGSKGARPQH